jgi:hypothetical protein
MSQFDTTVFKTWAKEATPKYTERRLNLRQVMAEFFGEYRHFTAPLGANKAQRHSGTAVICVQTIRGALNLLFYFF